MRDSLRSARPIFPVRDLDEAAGFYRSLGFTVEIYRDGRYAWVTSPVGEVLHLAVIENLDRAANHCAAYLHVDDVEMWHTRWTNAGAPVSAIEDKPWGMREFSSHDPDRNLLRVGQNL